MVAAGVELKKHPEQEMCMGKVQGVGSNLDLQRCVIESEMHDLQDLCSASADLWQ